MYPRMKRSAIIDVKKLVKRYKKAEKNAVDGISFEVGEGEFFSLLGPNGAGKTTTISILTTILEKTSGTITIAGFDIDKNSSEIRRNVGIIFQKPSLDQNLTAEENIRFHTVLYGLYGFRPFFSWMPEHYQKKVKELAHVLGIEKEIFDPIKTFSGGMKRKLEIIRSLMHSPKVLFLDEPTLGLDPISRKNLWEYLRFIRTKEPITIFLTTHYLEEAEEADNLCIINEGKIVSYGTASQIKSDLVQEYLILDSPKKAELREELAKKKIPFSENGTFKIRIRTDDISRIIKLIRTPLSVVKTHNPSLEEAYIEIIEKGERDAA